MKKRKEKAETTARRWPKFWRRYINGSRGVISLFLAILMVPFVMIAGALINAGRINSAVAIFDEALCNASNSTLGTYDTFLRERFGLLAMSQNTASGGSAYTVQNLISDTFQEYMEENLKVLSNTYTSSEVSAAGIYPLADTNVLLSEVLEYSKYTVPTKLVIDGLSLDDIINKLTSSLSLWTSCFNTAASGFDMKTTVSNCHTSLENLKTTLNESLAAKEEYDVAYNQFKTAVEAYNNLVDEMQQAVQSEESAVTAVSDKSAACQTRVQAEAEKHSELVAMLEALENETDANGNPVDNSEKIAEFKAEHADDLEAYLKAREDLVEAQKELSDAQTNLTNKTASYNTSLSEKRTAVETAKAAYVLKTGSYANAVKESGEAVQAAQSSVASASQAGVNLLTNIGTTVFEAQKTTIDDQIKDLQKQQEQAEQAGQKELSGELKKKITGLKDQQTKIGNTNTITNASGLAVNEEIQTLDDFSKLDYQQTYSELYSALIEVKVNVKNYTIPTGNTKMESAVPPSYYLGTEEPLSAAEIEKMEENLEQQVQNEAFFAVLKALVSFIKALLDVSAWFAPELNAVIDNSYYSGIGGLPSQKGRSSTSPYCLDSEFADEDSKQSEYYKDLLGAYSSNGLNAGSVGFAEFLATVIEDINTIISYLDPWHWYNIAELWVAATDLMHHIGDLAENMLQTIREAIYQKALLAGYIAYNTANRTTYEGTALTGAGFSLPKNLTYSISDLLPGNRESELAFYGAETEYIINGKMDEIFNQSSVFNSIYLIRFAFDIAVIALNSEVWELAEAAGAPTFGIGAVLVLVLYFLAEPFADTLILVNGGTVPIIKLQPYLAPSGIPKFIEKFLSLGFSSALKEGIYKEVIDISKSPTTTTYEDAVKQYETGSNTLDSILDAFSFDYTKMLLLIMMFMDSETLLDRLCDVIQMESTYHALKERIDTYVFDLDNSYTYLRASGSFTTNEFIRLSDSSGLMSKERVVYRGY